VRPDRQCVWFPPVGGSIEEMESLFPVSSLFSLGGTNRAGDAGVECRSPFWVPRTELHSSPFASGSDSRAKMSAFRACLQRFAVPIATRPRGIRRLHLLGWGWGLTPIAPLARGTSPGRGARVLAIFPGLAFSLQPERARPVSPGRNHALAYSGLTRVATGLRSGRGREPRRFLQTGPGPHRAGA
jgi:hypothetical protein